MDLYHSTPQSAELVSKPVGTVVMITARIMRGVVNRSMSSGRMKRQPVVSRPTWCSELCSTTDCKDRDGSPLRSAITQGLWTVSGLRENPPSAITQTPTRWRSYIPA